MRVCVYDHIAWSCVWCRDTHPFTKRGHICVCDKRDARHTHYYTTYTHILYDLERIENTSDWYITNVLRVLVQIRTIQIICFIFFSRYYVCTWVKFRLELLLLLLLVLLVAAMSWLSLSPSPSPVGGVTAAEAVDPWPSTTITTAGCFKSIALVASTSQP